MVSEFEKHGMQFVGHDSEARRMEIMELKGHSHFSVHFVLFDMDFLPFMQVTLILLEFNFILNISHGL